MDTIGPTSCSIMCHVGTSSTNQRRQFQKHPTAYFYIITFPPTDQVSFTRCVYYIYIYIYINKIMYNYCLLQIHMYIHLHINCKYVYTHIYIYIYIFIFIYVYSCTNPVVGLKIAKMNLALPVTVVCHPESQEPWTNHNPQRPGRMCRTFWGTLTWGILSWTRGVPKSWICHFVFQNIYIYTVYIYICVRVNNC